MFEKNLLNGQTIVITGGGTGLGKSMSRRFGELGANIVISGRRKEKLEETADEFSKLGINVLTCPGDVRKLEDVELMTSQAIDKFGKIDGLLNNAAGNFISPTEMLSPNAFKVVIDIVLMGTWNCTSTIGKEMIKNKKGNKIPMKRFGERHELENLASYLMSDGSAYINGEVVTIDGGEWLAGAAEFSEMDKIPDSLWKAMASRRKKK